MEHIVFFVRQVLGAFGSYAIDNFDNQMQDAFLHLVATGQKIEAIKMLRLMTMSGAPIKFPYVVGAKPVPEYIRSAIDCTNDASKRGEFGGPANIMSLYDAKLVIDTVFHSVYGNMFPGRVDG